MKQSCVVFAVLFAALIAVGCAQTELQSVSYVSNPACATSAGGCDFLNPAIWNATVANTSQIIIESSVPITLLLTNTTIEIASLSFGLQTNSSVNIVLTDSTLEVNGALVWGGSSTVVVVSSTLVSTTSVVGANATLNNGELGGSRLSLNSLLASNNSAFGGGYTTVTYVDIRDTQLISSNFATLYMVAYNSDLEMSELYIGGSAEIHNCSSQYGVQFTLYNETTLEIHDTNITLYQLSLSFMSKFSFHSQNSAMQLRVNTVSSFAGAELHLGDNVIATIGNGYIYNFTTGNNVTVNFGEFIADIIISNMQQDAGVTTPTAITMVSKLSLASLTPVLASVNVTSGTFFAGNLSLAAGSSLFGNGYLSLQGFLNCPTCNIQIGMVFFDGTYGTGSLNVTSLVTPNIAYTSYGSGINGSVTGAVTIQPVYWYDGLDYALSSNKLTIEGSYTQIGGYLNFTWQDGSSTFLEVSNAVVLQNVTIYAVIGNVLAAGGQHPLVKSQSGNLTVNNTIILNYAMNKWNLELTTKDGGLYFGLPATSTDSVWDKYKLYIIIGAAVAGTLIFAAIVLGVMKRVKHARRHHYAPIHH